MSKIILITGASAGFGKATAEKFAAGGWNLILTARRKEQLEAVAADIEKKYGVKTLALVFDIQDKKAVFEHLGNLHAARESNSCPSEVLETWCIPICCDSALS